ncbi:MAG: DegT/DnrJ/EryC1/StrS family aminotransferase, partial [Candidatus Omnitrophota bacterium]
NENKIKKAKLLNEKLSGIREVKIFKEKTEAKNIYLNYVIRVKEREKLIKYLFKNGIDIIPGFVISCAAQDQFKEFRCECPNSLIMQSESLYLPIYSPIKKETILRIVGLIKKYYGVN